MDSDQSRFAPGSHWGGSRSHEIWFVLPRFELDQTNFDPCSHYLDLNLSGFGDFCRDLDLDDLGFGLPSPWVYPEILWDLDEFLKGLDCDHMMFDPVSYTMSWNTRRFMWVFSVVTGDSLRLAPGTPREFWDLSMFEFFYWNLYCDHMRFATASHLLDQRSQ